MWFSERINMFKEFVIDSFRDGDWFMGVVGLFFFYCYLLLGFYSVI